MRMKEKQKQWASYEFGNAPYSDQKIVPFKSTVGFRKKEKKKAHKPILF